MRLLSFIALVILMYSCTASDTTTENIQEEPYQLNLSQDSKIFLGNRLFSEKTCITCHDIDRKKIGPSIIEIMNIYKEQNGDIVQFLKGNNKPIVDTIAAEVAIMQANIDGFLKNITDVELDAIATYMMHVDELKKK